MSFVAQALEVMIASPSDVALERQQAREVIQEWNAVHSKDRGLVLLPVAWDTHSSPEMGARPQEIINKQILKDCDILIAVFWARTGSPTGKAASGTVEEVEEHIKAGKPTLVYFSNAPVRLDSVDDQQYTALKAFRESIKARGLCESYDTVSEFRDKLTRQIAQTVIRRFTATNEGTPEAALPDGRTYIKSKARPDLPTPMSEEAAELLAAAAASTNGAILRLRVMGGPEISTNNLSFGERGNPRDIARWDSAVNELSKLGLTEDRAGKGEVYFVTRDGYDTADHLGRTE